MVQYSKLGFVGSVPDFGGGKPGSSDQGPSVSGGGAGTGGEGPSDKPEQPSVGGGWENSRPEGGLAGRGTWNIPNLGWTTVQRVESTRICNSVTSLTQNILFL